MEYNVTTTNICSVKNVQPNKSAYASHISKTNHTNFSVSVEDLKLMRAITFNRTPTSLIWITATPNPARI